MNRVDETADVYQADVNLSDWVVWAPAADRDGGVLVATFSGPAAELRAIEYAEQKFAGFQLHAPDQRQYGLRQSTFVAVGQSSSRGANLRLVK